MTSVHPLARDTDEDFIETLREFLHARKLEENLSRPSSHEAVAEAVAAAERSSLMRAMRSLTEGFQPLADLS